MSTITLLHLLLTLPSTVLQITLPHIQNPRQFMTGLTEMTRILLQPLFLIEMAKTNLPLPIMTTNILLTILLPHTNRSRLLIEMERTINRLQI
jgi:hypothetical protein